MCWCSNWKLNELDLFKAPRAGKAADLFSTPHWSWLWLLLAATLQLVIPWWKLWVLTICQHSGFNIGIDLSKGWVTLPPANHGLAASPIPGSVGSNTLESLVLPPFSVGVWFYTWPHSNRLWPFSQPSFAISSEIGGPALVLGSALGLALVALAFPLGLTGCWCWCRPSCWRWLWIWCSAGFWWWWPGGLCCSSMV